MSEASTEPEEVSEEALVEGESSGGEAVEGEPVPGVAAAAADACVMKVLGTSSPPWLKKFPPPPPPPPWRL